MKPPRYRLHWLNRRGKHVWEFPIAGTAPGRRIPLRLAIRGIEPLEFSDVTALDNTRMAINAWLSALGAPGRVFSVFTL